MNRSQKEQSVKEIQDKLLKTKGLFLFEYHGLSVEDLTGLRRQLKKGGGELKVYKNTLIRKALQGTTYEESLSKDFKGPIACAFGYEDVVPPAKTLVEFEKEEKKLNIRAGVLKDKKLSTPQILQLAKLPSREVLLGQLVGVLAAPMRAFVTVLSAVPRDFVYALKAIEQKKAKE